MALKRALKKVFDCSTYRSKQSTPFMNAFAIRVIESLQIKCTVACLIESRMNETANKWRLTSIAEQLPYAEVGNS